MLVGVGGVAGDGSVPGLGWLQSTCDASDDAGGTPSPDHPTTRSTRWLVSADPYSSLLGSVTT